MLHLAGDFHETLETERPSVKPHLMSVMLVSNLDVPQRFVNGCQGRLLSWFPDKLPQKRKVISASCPELTARFVKEASTSKSEMLADIDFMDVNVRQESINNVPGQPVQIQLGVVPGYGLTGDRFSFDVFYSQCPPSRIIIKNHTSPQNTSVIDTPHCPRDTRRRPVLSCANCFSLYYAVFITVVRRNTGGQTEQHMNFRSSKLRSLPKDRSMS